ncbi:MAG: UTP--glucose-1-phosphate uridylyltransferase [Clostridiales bacterium]|jgi:UDP-N-acetylglucosamine pyrophosphorylase|nr:UTP--glucose-1-phosphate uridylyltransferase [Clostridiales bacterium]
MDKLVKIKAILSEYGQEHLLDFYSELSLGQQENLLTQIESVNFELMQELYLKTVKRAGVEESGITPITITNSLELSGHLIAEYKTLGSNLMKEGKFAVVTMAGGQGTRLGCNGPKGIFDIGLPSHKSLFEIQCDRLKFASKMAGIDINWYIMTSRENDLATKDFFEKNNYFGYKRGCVDFFTQRMLPMLDLDGKIILEEKFRIREGADGHGGIFSAMQKSGVYSDICKKGIEWLFIGGIDNVLIQLADPLFIGFAAASNCYAAGKSILKRDAYEKAGVFCRRNGHPSVVEYTEISSEMAELRNDKDQFVYGDVHILCNIFNINIFKLIGDQGLPYHAACKKSEVIGKNGERISPQEPNAYKFEAFIFDAFSFLEDLPVLRVKRETEFAPVKNKIGEDSPETAREMLIKVETERFI